MDLHSLEKIAIELADAAKEVTLRYFRNLSTIETKADQSFVTVADREAENVMVDIIQSKLPQFGVIREEGEDIESSCGMSWVLDPIDGTSSFISGRPIWGTLIGLVDKNQKVVLGIIDQPYLHERWIGVDGRKTSLNGKEVTSNQIAELSQAALFKTTPAMFSTDWQKAVLQKVEELCGGRSLWGGDCYSYGAIAASFGSPGVILECGMKYHDFAALIPVVKGSGGRITNWKGEALTAKDTTVLASSNKELHKIICDNIFQISRDYV